MPKSTKFPSCCGITIIHQLDDLSERWMTEKIESVKRMISRELLGIARSSDYELTGSHLLMASVAPEDSMSQDAAVDILELYKFKQTETFFNAFSENEVLVYCKTITVKVTRKQICKHLGLYYDQRSKC